MKILVTGGSGFLGSHVADELTNYGHKVIIYDLLKSKWLKKNQKFIKGNITDTKKLSRLISGTDIVYNFAALGDLDKARFMPIETVNYNILSLVYMLKLSKKFKIKRFVQASSVYADSEEGGFYGRSKFNCRKSGSTSTTRCVERMGFRSKSIQGCSLGKSNDVDFSCK